MKDAFEDVLDLKPQVLGQQHPRWPTQQRHLGHGEKHRQVGPPIVDRGDISTDKDMHRLQGRQGKIHGCSKQPQKDSHTKKVTGHSVVCLDRDPTGVVNNQPSDR